MCVCSSRRSWRQPRGLYEFHAERLPVTITWQNLAFFHVCLYQGSVTREAGLISAGTHTRCLSGHSSSELFVICLCAMTLRVLVTWLVFHDNHFLVPSLLTSILRSQPTRICLPISCCGIELSQKTKTDDWKSIFEEYSFCMKVNEGWGC